MTIRNIRKIIYIYIGVILSFSCISQADDTLPIPNDEKRNNEINELKLQDIHAYGSVIDQNGNPIAGAYVLISWEEFATPFPGPVQDLWVQSDLNGQWEIKKRAISMCVLDAKADGHIFSKRQQDRKFKSDDLENNLTSPTNRIAIRLHKRNDPTFLIIQDGRLGRATPEAPLARQFDLIQKKTRAIADATNQMITTFYPDLELMAERGGSNGGWRVVYRTTGNDDGLIATNSLLFEAPESGYVSECVLVDVHEQDYPRYIYIRSRTPAIYTRLDIQHSLRPDSCGIMYNSVSNPYGTRSLESHDDFNILWRLQEQLTKEARSEISAGRRLNKDDLPGRIEEAKEAAERD